MLKWASSNERHKQKEGEAGEESQTAAKSKQEASSRKPVWKKYMKLDFINLNVSQPNDRKREEKERQNLHNILMS